MRRRDSASNGKRSFAKHDAVILLIFKKHLAHKVEMCFDLCYNLDISLKNKSKKAFYIKISQLQKMKSIA